MDFLLIGLCRADALAGTSGSVTRRYDYDAFGNELEVAGNPSGTDANPFRYCGEYWDNETETYYLRARYYDPSIGRFLSEDTHWNPSNMTYGDNPVKWNERESNDPLGLNTYTLVPNITAIMQSGNLYAYCLNNPLLYQDPGGESIILTCIIVGAIIGAVAGGGYAAYKSHQELGYVNGWWVLGGAAAGALLAGSATATTMMVVIGAQLKIAGLMTTGYATFEAFKKTYGSAGSGMAWHHIVPQTAANIQRFGAEMIHNAANIVKIPHGANTLHQMITNHYNTLHSSGVRVHQWLQTQSFDAQFAYGLQKLTEYAKQLGIAIEFVK